MFSIVRFPTVKVVAEWLKHLATGSLMEIEARVRIPFYISDRCGYGCQAMDMDPTVNSN